MRFIDLFIRSLPSESLGNAIRSMVDLNERLTLDKIRSRAAPILQTNGPPSPVSGRSQVPYDPSVVFMVELMMSIAGEAEHAIMETW
jgi:brefeldin A-resistance guanine nucleotide exchange factor 1